MSDALIYICFQRITTVNPLLSPPGGLFISNQFEEGGLIEKGDLFERRGLFNLEKTMVSILHKKLEYKVEALKYKRLEVMQPRIKNNSELLLGTINHPGSVHRKFYSCD